MTTDFDDPDLEQLLAQRGAELRRDLDVPDLNGMISHAVRPARPHLRWTWPLLAAVLLLAIPLVTVIALHRGTGSHPAPATTSDPGNAYLGDVTVVRAVLQPGGSTVSILVNPDPPGNYCLGLDLPDFKPVVTETDDAVTIKVQAYGPPQPTATEESGYPVVCAGVGHGLAEVKVELNSKLGTRSILDGSGTKVSLIDGSAFFTPSYLPAGYDGSGSVLSGGGFDVSDALNRTYTKDQDRLIITRSDPMFEQPNVLADAVVHGQPAKIEQDGAWNDNICITWSEGGQPWSVCSLGVPPALSSTELIKIANGLH